MTWPTDQSDEPLKALRQLGIAGGLLRTKFRLTHSLEEGYEARVTAFDARTGDGCCNGTEPSESSESTTKSPMHPVPN